MLSLDGTINDPESPAGERFATLSATVGKVVVLVPDKGNKLLALFKLWRKARKLSTPFDLVTVQDPYFLGFLAVKLAEKFQIPLEVQVHGFEKTGGLRARLARCVITRATKIRVVSERLRKELTKSYKLKATSLYTLPVYTQIEELVRKPKRNTVPYPFTFLTVGRLVSVKNISLQITAFAKLAKEVPHVRLQIVGEGPLLQSLQYKVKSLKLEDKVIFEGEQKNVGKYYTQADAFLLTSDYEGWGRVALEAAAYRLPVIMTNVGLANEVLHNEESCIVVPVGDEEQLYLAMKELLDAPSLRVQLGEGAFKAFKALPSSEEEVKKQVEYWRSFT